MKYELNTEDLITRLNIENVREGTYIWSIFQHQQLIETGKLIITH